MIYVLEVIGSRTVQAISMAGEQEEQLAKVTTRVSERYLRMAVFAGLLYRVADALAALDVSYNIPLHLLHENLAYKMDALGQAARARSAEKGDGTASYCSFMALLLLV